MRSNNKLLFIIALLLFVIVLILLPSWVTSIIIGILFLVILLALGLLLISSIKNFLKHYEYEIEYFFEILGTILVIGGILYLAYHFIRIVILGFITF